MWKRGRLGEKQMELREFEVVKKVRKLYTQDWKAYNQAKTKERLIAESLLLELIDYFPQKISKGTKSGYSLKDKIIFMFYYAYNGFSSRRTIPDLEVAKRRYIISETPYFNTILNVFRKEEMISILSQLIEITSLPLRMFEEHFAVDSSGFSTSQFERWVNVRTQNTSKIRNWKKAHIISGVRTNIIASVKITDGTCADCPELIPLVEKTNKLFDMKEVSADKAYLSRDNLQKIASLGCIPYIPFKSNSKKNPYGVMIWKTMYDFFHNNQEAFMEKYHLRSNVETSFSMIKRCYGNRLRTGKFTSQINEILMKCLCHNLSVLVQESFELGLEIDLKKCAGDYFAQQHN